MSDTPHELNLDYFELVASKGEDFARFYHWLDAEVRAGRRSPAQQLQSLNRYWQELQAWKELL